MTAISQTERADLCDLALVLGEDQPTLCEGWTIKDLVVHLLVREGSPASVGISISRLAGLTDLASRRLAARDFTVLVERLRGGPPRYSPLRIGPVERLVNSIELFVHHEDIRRAQPDWSPRDLSPGAQNLLWKQLRLGAKRLVRDAKVGMVLERSDTDERAVLKASGSSVVVRGLPGELVLYVFGRRQQAEVEVLGSAADLAALDASDLGV
ncbi:MAG TPA: TIGR03085 family metal-binding protein [Nocardioidaceae bacterium]|nr:TIGR03085 family metal-binding protein [Nocardioidaceae bacterium]